MDLVRGQWSAAGSALDCSHLLVLAFGSYSLAQYRITVRLKQSAIGSCFTSLGNCRVSYFVSVGAFFIEGCTNQGLQFFIRTPLTFILFLLGMVELFQYFNTNEV
jgi:hypothetical protein